MTRILLAGATGMVGRQVATIMSAPSIDGELHVISRRQINGLDSSAIQHIVEPANWTSPIIEVAPQVIISCLGTTIKSAGSKSAFTGVDFDLITLVGQAARAAGTRHMILVSSVGANASSANFYLSIKGKTENAIRALGFERLDIIRPGLLRGIRENARTGESLGIMLSPLTDVMMQGPFRRYRSIDGGIVAKAIANLSVAGGQGTFIHENDSITELAG